MRIRRSVFVLFAFTLAGCSAAATTTPSASVPVSATAAPSSVTPTPTPTPSPSASKPSGLALGQSFEQQSVKLTVSEVKAQPKGNHDQPLVGAMAQACNNTVSPVTFSSRYWTVAAADGSMFKPASLSYENDPTPRYPNVPEIVANGQCVKGWILFEVPAGVTIDTVRYATPDTGGAPMLATWLAH